MLKRINESHKAEEKHKFCKTKSTARIFSLLSYFYAFGRETHLNVTLPAERKMAIIQRESQGEVP